MVIEESGFGVDPERNAPGQDVVRTGGGVPQEGDLHGDRRECPDCAERVPRLTVIPSQEVEPDPDGEVETVAEPEPMRAIAFGIAHVALDQCVALQVEQE